jgi:AraC-like DNA-binding protein
METKTPFWQQLSGINPETEREMAAEERDAAILKIIDKADEIINAEMTRAVPAGQRTVFWDPIERVCALLEISRTKLSRYSYELTGLRAHERSDKVKAARLPGDLQALVELFIANLIETALRPLFANGSTTQQEIENAIAFAFKALRQERSGPAAARHAMDLGYANPSRLKHACKIAHGMSLEEMERNIVAKLVQKFFDDLNQQQQSEPRPDVEPAVPVAGAENARAGTDGQGGNVTGSRSSQRIVRAALVETAENSERARQMAGN